MEIVWNTDSNFTFHVYIKHNQEIKYLNTGSSHTPDCFKAINKGVCHRLTKRTLSTPTNNKTKVNDIIYSHHFEVLSKAGLTDGIVTTTLEEGKGSIPASLGDIPSAEIKKHRAGNHKRSIYFKVGYLVKLLETSNPQDHHQDQASPL